MYSNYTFLIGKAYKMYNVADEIPTLCQYNMTQVPWSATCQ